MKFKNTFLTLAIFAVICCVRFTLVSKAEECPTPHEPVSNGPYPGSIFTYYLDGVQEEQKASMRSAFGTWHAQNFFRNCSIVNFIEGGTRPAIQGKYDIFVI